MKLSKDQRRKKKVAQKRKQLARNGKAAQIRRMLDTGKLAPTVQKVREALEADGLRIFCRIVNSRLDYSLAGPQDYEVASEWISVALIEGITGLKRSPHPTVSEKITRSDGQLMTYDQVIWYDFANGRLYTTITSEDTLRSVVAFVAQDLHREAEMAMSKKTGEPN